MRSLNPQPLVDFCGYLAVVVDKLVTEDADPLRIAFDVNTAVGNLRVPPDDLLKDVTDTYGPAVRIRLLRRLAGGEDQVVADWEAGSAAFRDSLKQLMALRPASDTVTIRIRLDKDAITAGHAETAVRRRSFLFWYNFEQLLLGDLPTVAKGLWGNDRASRCHVFVGDESPFCIGPLLVVTHSPPQSEIPTTGIPFDLIELERMDSERRDAISWSSENLAGGLVPEHFLLYRSDHIPTAELLAGHLLWVTVASLADRSAEVDAEAPERFGRFEGSTGFVEVRVPRRIRTDAKSQEALSSAVQWVYARGPEGASVVSQRLGPVQARVAEVLGSVRAEDRAGELVRLMPEILSASKWRWRCSLSQEAAQSLQREIDAIEKAEAAAQGFVDETRSISEHVVSVVRGAAVAIVGAFIAAALDPQLTTLAIRSAGLAYASLVLFLWVTSTLESRRRIELKWASYQDARTKRARLVGPERLDQVETISVAREKQRAHRHLWWSSIAYAVFFAASIAFATLGPRLIG